MFKVCLPACLLAYVSVRPLMCLPVCPPALFSSQGRERGVGREGERRREFYLTAADSTTDWKGLATGHRLVERVWMDEPYHPDLPPLPLPPSPCLTSATPSS